MAAVDSIDREMLQIRDLQRAGEFGVTQIINVAFIFVTDFWGDFSRVCVISHAFA